MKTMMKGVQADGPHLLLQCLALRAQAAQAVHALCHPQPQQHHPAPHVVVPQLLLSLLSSWLLPLPLPCARLVGVVVAAVLLCCHSLSTVEAVVMRMQTTTTAAAAAAAAAAVVVLCRWRLWSGR